LLTNIERKSLGNRRNEDKIYENACPDEWLNYKNEFCFYGSQQEGTFYDGVNQCGLLNANFGSIDSLQQIKFIINNFDVKKYWIGIIYGEKMFQDGSQVTHIYM